MRFTVALSKVFQVFPPWGNALGSFQCFCPRAFFFTELKHDHVLFFFVKFESFLFHIYLISKQKKKHLHQKLKLLHISSIYIYSVAVLSNGCELRCNLVCGLSRLISPGTWWMRRGPTLRCISVTPDEIFHQSWEFPRLTAVLVNVFGIRLHTNLVKSNNLQRRFH